MVQQQLTFKQQMDGFPWTQLLVISLVRFSEPIAFSSLFPYVYFMVKDFHVAPNDAQVSKYSGYLSSCFALCQVVAAFHWGKFSEKYGRKKALTLGLIGTSISLLILGFSKSFYQALLARSMMGLLNGNVGVLRTMIGEIATERRHQALAFSTMPLLFQFGTVVGPMIGGFLVFRQQDGDTIPQWLPKAVQNMVHKYPYSLPNLVVCFLLTLGLINAVLFLEETHPHFKYQRDYGVEIGDVLKKYVFGIQPRTRPWQSIDTTSIPEENETSSPIDDNSNEENLSDTSEADSIQSVGGVLTRRQSVGLIRTYSIHEPTDFPANSRDLAPDGCQTNSAYHNIMHTKLFYPISVNFIMALHLIVYNEFLPIFLAYDLARDPKDRAKLASKFPWKILGGIGYVPEQTGKLLSTTGIFGCFVVIFIFPIVDRSFDCLTIFRTLVKFYPVMYIMVPYVIFLQQDNIPRWGTIVYLYMITGIKTFCGALTSPQIMLLIHNSSPLGCRAVINGASISITAAARFIGPLLWGYIMSWSQQNDVAWLSWWSLGFICIVALYQSYKIDPIEEDTNGHNDEESHTTRSRPSLGDLSNRQK